MITSSTFRFSLCMIACIFFLHVERSRATYIPTNIDLTVRAVDVAVAKSLAALDTIHSRLSSDLPALITAETKNDANWIVEHSLASALLKQGFEVMTDSTAAPSAATRGTTTPGTASAPSTTGAPPPLCAACLPAQPPAQPHRLPPLCAHQI